MKKKKIVFLIIFIWILFSYSSVYAATCSSLTSTANNFVNAGANNIPSNVVSGITAPIVPVIQILSVGGVIVVGMCYIILGIQWVMSRPSPEAQGKLKERLFALTVTAGILLGSYTIFTLVVNILSIL